MSWLDSPSAGWPCQPCLIAIPLAALVVIVLRPAFLAKIFGGNSERPAANTASVNIHAHCGERSFKMVPSGRATPVLRARDDQMAWFSGIVQRICEVRHGIFHGQSEGDTLPSWGAPKFAAALTELRGRVATTTWPECDPLDDVALASRLIATDLNVDEAAKLVEEYAGYRREMGGGVTPSAEWLECGIVFVPCEDFLGRPVVNVRPRYHRPGNVDLFRHGLRTCLDAIKAHSLHKRAEGFSETNPLEQYTMIWDFAGAGMQNLDWEAFHCTIFEGAHHYPNMGSQIYVLNVSAPLRWVWATASRFLHPRVRRKCILLPPSEVGPCMRKVVPAELLPPEYGGTGAPWPGPTDALTFEDQVGALAAEAYRRAGAVPVGARPMRGAASPARAPASAPASPSRGARRGGSTTWDRLCRIIPCFGG